MILTLSFSKRQLHLPVDVTPYCHESVFEGRAHVYEFLALDSLYFIQNLKFTYSSFNRLGTPSEQKTGIKWAEPPPSWGNTHVTKI